MAEPYFFGYGSLVNRATHDFADPHPARLRGWCRAWRHTDLRPVAFLTAVPAPGVEIDGMIAHVPGGDWEALDQREWAYDRVPATRSVSHPVSTPVDIAVYAVPESRHTTPTDGYPILLSYLDVVIQGYLREFGESGADRFFATTKGWDSPILDDRSAPRYPRHQQLTADQTAYVDDRLAALPVRIVTAPVT
ncbi:gamma-glutamylcyclotransferase family protein [Sedimentitalea todarodis]|uniref:Gamma-glutamylcyclotransferase family protein n=1 Tax=Sedimentitalea todarodis TaxID=1631240 RepID=A0ABU3VFW1_9RHOB|nr:gamma-glutamylcyclotransferase family protein [Sedimentitalea todarodis]MDU9004978.1 gamma-glutamylcyclotransferase family protein [Sedimentitalea todarodis]